MLIPITYHRYTDYVKAISNIWAAEACKISMEYGVIVMWNILEDETGTHIFFLLNNHQFETSRDIRRALDNKAFL